jgi:hypothetical protein
VHEERVVIRARQSVRRNFAPEHQVKPGIAGDEARGIDQEGYHPNQQRRLKHWGNAEHFQAADSLGDRHLVHGRRESYSLAQA